MTDWRTSDRDVDRVIRSWLHKDRHEDVSRVAGAVLTQAETTPQRRSTWWPARRTPIVNKIVGFSVAAAVAVVVLVIGAQLYGSPRNVGFRGEPTPTVQPTPGSSPGFSRFTSTMHGISIDYPAGWQIRPASERWTGGALNFDSPAADVIFDPVLGDGRYIVLASRTGRADDFDDQSDQFRLIRESGVCDPEGGMGGGDFTVAGASAWGQHCDPGIDGATYVEAVAVTTDAHGYLIVLVESDDEPGPSDAYDFAAALETVDLPLDDARRGLDEPLGQFDLDGFERRFGVELSPRTTLAGSSNIQYDSGDVDGEEPAFALHFTVDADNPNNAVVGTGITSPLPDYNAALVDEWLAFVAETQPDAAAWLVTERDGYLAAPGAEISRAKWFGGLCAGLSTSRPMFAPSSDVNSFYMWVQYEFDCP